MKNFLLLALMISLPAMANQNVTNNPLNIVQTWAKAVKERNGKKQYSLLCKQQQNKNRATLQELNWVTGVSSPSVGNFKITQLKQNQYSVSYQILLQNKDVGRIADTIQVTNGCISSFKYLSPSAVAPVE